jgi:hypothetical protein
MVMAKQCVPQGYAETVNNVEGSVVRSSVIPSAKYCCSRSSLRLAKGSTTIDRRGATGDWLICTAGCTLAPARKAMGPVVLAVNFAGKRCETGEF